MLLGGLELCRGSLVAESGLVLPRRHCVLALALGELSLGARFGASLVAVPLESGGGQGRLRGCRAPLPLAGAAARCGGACACCELQ